MNSHALEIMRAALERIAAIRQPTCAPAEESDREQLLEKLDFSVITARKALDRVAMPDVSKN